MEFPSTTKEIYTKNPDSFQSLRVRRFADHTKLSMFPQKKVRRKVAYHHFHPDVVASMKDKGLFPAYVNAILGKKIGLGIQDRFSENDAERAFLNVPNITLFAAEQFLMDLKVSSKRNSREVREQDEAKQKKIRLNERKMGKDDVFMNSLTKKQQKVFKKMKSDLEKNKKKLEKKEQEIEKKEQEIEVLTHHGKDLRTLISFHTHDNEFLRILTKYGGVSRVNLCSPKWHEEYPNACKEFFGFNKYRQMQIRLKCWFFEKFTVYDHEKQERVENFEVSLCDGPMSDYEKCLVTIMRFHRRTTLESLSAIWGRFKSQISRYIAKWAPLLGNAGLQVSILDLTPEFLEYAMPEEYKSNGLDKVGALVDGKIFMTHECRVHNGIKRAQYSDKVHHGGALMHDWILPCGLGFEHTPLYMGRVTESALVSLWGSCTQKKFGVATEIFDEEQPI
jgi:hypothetical protein